MMNGKTLALLDPSIGDYSGSPSRNLGDLIIYDAVKAVLDEVFPEWNVQRFSSHMPYRKADCAVINRATLTVLGGTNALCSYHGGHSWYTPHEGLFYLFPKIRNNILMGVGWGHGYPHLPNRKMKIFYHRILSRKWMHSVRDEFTRQHLERIGIRNVINTGCPTTWRLNGVATRRTNLKTPNCLFTITDYAPDPENDNALIDLIAESTPGRIVNFPQGDQDRAYIESLAAYQRHKERIEIHERSYKALRRTLGSERDFHYIGTRLHCGVAALQHGWNALILQVDNRAAEMARDCHLPVVPRNDFAKMKEWLAGNLDFGAIAVPLERIEQWKGQFKKLKA
jgi:polysaccharide pyruvyl transferase WcaK-like protein